jgi:hypothetical protein
MFSLFVATTVFRITDLPDLAREFHKDFSPDDLHRHSGEPELTEDALNRMCVLFQKAGIQKRFCVEVMMTCAPKRSKKECSNIWAKLVQAQNMRAKQSNADKKPAAEKPEVEPVKAPSAVSELLQFLGNDVEQQGSSSGLELSSSVGSRSLLSELTDRTNVLRAAASLSGNHLVEVNDVVRKTEQLVLAMRTGYCFSALTSSGVPPALMRKLHSTMALELVSDVAFDGSPVAVSHILKSVVHVVVGLLQCLVSAGDDALVAMDTGRQLFSVHNNSYLFPRTKTRFPLSEILQLVRHITTEGGSMEVTLQVLHDYVQYAREVAVQYHEAFFNHGANGYAQNKPLLLPFSASRVPKHPNHIRIALTELLWNEKIDESMLDETLKLKEDFGMDAIKLVKFANGVSRFFNVTVSSDAMDKLSKTRLVGELVAVFVSDVFVVCSDPDCKFAGKKHVTEEAQELTGLGKLEIDRLDDVADDFWTAVVSYERLFVKSHLEQLQAISAQPFSGSLVFQLACKLLLTASLLVTMNGELDWALGRFNHQPVSAVSAISAEDELHTESSTDEVHTESSTDEVHMESSSTGVQSKSCSTDEIYTLADACAVYRAVQDPELVRKFHKDFYPKDSNHLRSGQHDMDQAFKVLCTQNRAIMKHRATPITF